MTSMTVPLMTLLASSLLAAYLFYGLARVHPDLEQPDHLVWIYAKRTYIRALAIAGEYLGLGNTVQNARYLGTTSLLTLSSQLPDYEGIKAWSESFDGVPVRLYEPDKFSPNGPALIWIHGGGWVQGTAMADENLMAALCKRLGILIVNIDYRLAPEYPYPIPFDDCYKATVYLMSNADMYGFNPNRLVISGASAGGNLAAAVALKYRDEKHPVPLHKQILFVPCLQMFDFNTPSYQLNADDAFLPKYWMVYYWLWYAYGPSGHWRAQEYIDNTHTSKQAKQSEYARYVRHELVPSKYFHSSYMPNQNNYGNSTLWEESKALLTDPYFAPLMAKDLRGLPEAYIVTAHYDVLRDDGLMYGRRLEAAGVKVHQVHYDKGWHAQTHFPGTLDLTKKVWDDLVDYLRQNL